MKVPKDITKLQSQLPNWNVNIVTELLDYVLTLTVNLNSHNSILISYSSDGT